MTSKNKPLADILKDEVYDNLDFISKAIAPFVIEPLEEFNKKLPHLYEIDLLRLATESWLTYFSCKEMSINNLPKDVSDVINLLDSPLSEIELILDVPEGGIVVDIANQKVKGSAKIAINKPILVNDDDIQKIFIRLSYSFSNIYTPDVNRLHEIMEIFDLPKKSKSIRKCHDLLAETLSSKLYKTYNVRSFNALKSIIAWIRDYIENGNYDSLVNLTHFKVRTHSGLPIYDLKEVV